MKLVRVVLLITALMLVGLHAQAVVLTFDDIPDGIEYYHYYESTYQVGFSGNFILSDHSASSWGPPHSGKNVLVSWQPSYGSLILKASGQHYNAHTIGGYFSTEPGAMVQALAYHHDFGKAPVVVASAVIGAQEQSWTNTYLQLSSSQGIGYVDFLSLTPDALLHFCMDDITVNFVPEPSAILALLTGIAGISSIAWRRRR